MAGLGRNEVLVSRTSLEKSHCGFCGGSQWKEKGGRGERVGEGVIFLNINIFWSETHSSLSAIEPNSLKQARAVSQSIVTYLISGCCVQAREVTCRTQAARSSTRVVSIETRGKRSHDEGWTQFFSLRTANGEGFYLGSGMFCYNLLCVGRTISTSFLSKPYSHRYEEQKSSWLFFTSLHLAINQLAGLQDMTTLI